MTHTHQTATIALICPNCGHRIIRDRNSEDLIFGTLLHRGKARSDYGHHCTQCGRTTPAGTWMTVDV